MRIINKLLRSVNSIVLKFNPSFNTISTVRTFAAPATPQTVKDTAATVGGTNKQDDRKTCGPRMKGMYYIIMN